MTTKTDSPEPRLVTLPRAAEMLVSAGIAKSAMRYWYKNREAKGCSHVFKRPSGRRGRILVDLDALGKWMRGGQGGAA